MMHYNFNVFLINYKKDVIFLIDKNLLYEKMFHKPLSFDKYIKCKDKEYCWRLHLLDKIKKYPKHFLLIN